MVAECASRGPWEQLIPPTTPSSQRRTGGKVNWIQPAYANKPIITRTDEEIFSVSLAADVRDFEQGKRGP